MRIVVLLAMLTAVASAQPSMSPAPGSTTAAPPSGSTTAAPPSSGSDVPPAPAPPAAKTPRELCAEAMNQDPTFAQSILATLGKNVDQEIVKAHEDANYHVQKNERHVILAYAAMWVIAAAFVMFLWRRQQALKAEIAVLRRDLEAAAKEAK
ncbi:MAG: hypothetical protein JWO36_12 [Myxococcales bacterium]|nr:hypothetical protein [Myxococcales bacterium]